jgi:hypothetical protein
METVFPVMSVMLSSPRRNAPSVYKSD